MNWWANLSWTWMMIVKPISIDFFQGRMPGIHVRRGDKVRGKKRRLSWFRLQNTWLKWMVTLTNSKPKRRSTFLERYLLLPMRYICLFSEFCDFSNSLSMIFQPQIISQIQAGWPWYRVHSFRNPKGEHDNEPFFYHNYKKNPTAVRDVGELVLISPADWLS